MKIRNLLVLSTAFACGLTLASCGDNGKENNSQPANETKAFVGMGYDASYSENQANVTAAMVAFDANGKVLGARIDVVQCKVKKGENGGLALDLAENKVDGSRAKTKLELGKDYGMFASYGSQLAEVDNQIEAYAAWTVGKTVDEIKNAQAYGTVDDGHKENGYFTNDSALFEECTITVDSFARAIAKAYDNKSAASYNVSEGFKVGVAINASPAYNYGKPSVEVSVDLGGVALANGKVEAAAIDAVVFSFVTETTGEGEEAVTTVVADETGALSIDTAAKYHNGSTAESLKFISKKDLGDAYAMRSASPAGLEWFEQAVEIEEAVVGMTADDITAAESFGGATITVSSYASALSRAAKYAVLEHVGPQH